MWVGTAGGLFRRTPDGYFEHIDESDKNIGIVSFIMPVDDKIFVGANIKGLYSYSKRQNNKPSVFAGNKRLYIFVSL